MSEKDFESAPEQAEQLSEKILTEARADLSNAVYKAAEIFERMERLGLIRGNGHHMRQALAEHAVKMLEERWIR